MPTGLSVFDTTVQLTHIWTNELAELLGTEDTHRAYLALRAVLHALRDRLTVDGAAAFSAQLPMLVRGFYFEGWHPHGKPVKERKREEFLAHVRAAFPQDPDLDPEPLTRAVFQFLTNHISEGEIEKVKLGLPGEIRGLWPEKVAAMSL